MRVLAVGLLVASALFAQDSVAVKRGWKPMEFLFGNWVGKGGGATAGQGSGEYSFELQINKQIVVRRNFAEYTSGPEAGTGHDDLMVIYNETASGTALEPFRAIYFDSEGHVIRYVVKTPEANVAVFESDGTQPGPKYRLTYSLHGKDLEGKFEIAGLPGPGGAPDRDDRFKTYLTWTSVRK